VHVQPLLVQDGIGLLAKLLLSFTGREAGLGEKAEHRAAGRGIGEGCKGKGINASVLFRRQTHYKALREARRQRGVL
jgi:hypothetical protein